jgi:hypothetical protein
MVRIGRWEPQKRGVHRFPQHTNAVEPVRRGYLGCRRELAHPPDRRCLRCAEALGDGRSIGLRLVRRSADLRTISLGNGLSCLADRGIAGQASSSGARE